jgi:hypothetical protein
MKNGCKEKIITIYLPIRLISMFCLLLKRSKHFVRRIIPFYFFTFNVIVQYIHSRGKNCLNYTKLIPNFSAVQLPQFR